MSKIASKIGWGAFNTLCIFLFFLNTLVGIVAGIWLAFKGEWVVIVAGFIASLTMPYWWLIVGTPGMGLGFLAGVLAERGHKVGCGIFTFLANLYDSFLVVWWVTGIFLIVNELVTKGTLIPMSLWGYSVATAPLAFMASKEPPDSSFGSNTMVLVAETAYILLVVLSLCGVPLLFTLIIVVILMLIRTCLMLAVVYELMVAHESSKNYFTESLHDELFEP